MIAIGADHGGYDLKESIKSYLDKKHIEYMDFGTYNTDSVDYAEFALKVSQAIINKKCDKGILCCGTGIGISIAANKVRGIRAAVCTNEYCAEMTRRHNNANILCMGGRVISNEEAVKITDKFLNTQFDGGRHERRIAQITDIENLNL